MGEPRDTITRMINGVETAYVKAATVKAGVRPLWIAAPSNDSEATATIVIPIIKDGERVAMLGVNVPSVQFVQHFRNLENLVGFHVLSEKGDPLQYGVETQEERSVYAVVSAERHRIVTHDSKIRTFWHSGALIISQRVEGPEWIAVYVIPLSVFLSGISPLYWISVALALLVVFLLWILYFSYRRWVASPMEHEAARASELEAFRRSVLQTLPVGVIVFSMDSRRVLYANTFVCQLLGTAVLATIKQFCENVITQSKYCEGAEAFELMECSWSKSDDEEVELGVSIGASKFDGNDVILIGALDLSDRKEKEVLLQAAASAAEASNRAKSLFVAAISHEIRTPLHGAMGNLELLASQDIRPEHRQRVVVIHSAFDGLLTLVNDILDATKIESGAMRIRTREAVPNRSVSLALQNFAPTILARGLTLSYATDEILDHPLSIDDLRLGQILQNLLSNAVKFTARGGISVRSRWENTREAGGILVIDVQDTGIGISTDAQRRLFRALDQGDDGIGHRFGGTGLGLYLCRQLASLMGGTVEVDSDIGVGARFRLRIPAMKAASDTDIWPSMEGMRVAVCRTGAAANAALATWLESVGVSVCDDASAPVDVVIALFDVCDRDAGSIEVSQGICNRACLLRLTPDGPLVPRRDDRTVNLTSLDWLALRRFLHEYHNGSSQSEVVEASAIPVVGSGVVIVADDDEVSRLLICEQLRMLGVVDVRAYADGESAVVSHQDRPADLFLVDLNMPMLDGRGVVERLRVMKDEVKVIVVTAAGDKEIDELFRYFDDALQKPVTLAHLSRVLTNHLACGISDGVLASYVEKDLPNAKISDPVHMRMQSAFVTSWCKDRSDLTNAIECKDGAMLKRLLHRVEGALSVLGEDAMVKEVGVLQASAVDAWNADIESSLISLLAHLDDLVRTYANEGVASDDATP